MHQHNDRDCATEGIGGSHWGPVLAYLGKVEDAAKADGSGEFFKIYENGWKKNPAANQGDSDFWGTKYVTFPGGEVYTAADCVLLGTSTTTAASSTSRFHLTSLPVITCSELRLSPFTLPAAPVELNITLLATS